MEKSGSSNPSEILEIKSSEKPWLPPEQKTKGSEMKGQREDRTDSGFFSESLTPKLPPEAMAPEVIAPEEAPEGSSGRPEGQAASRRYPRKFEDIPVFETDSESEEHRSSEKVGNFLMSNFFQKFQMFQLGISLWTP